MLEHTDPRRPSLAPSSAGSRLKPAKHDDRVAQGTQTVLLVSAPGGHVMAAREKRLWEIEAHPTPDAQPEQKMTANQGARAEVQTRDFLRQILPKSTRLLEIT